NGLSTGTYSVTVTDTKACTYTTTAVITAPNPLSVSVASQTNVSCNGGNDGILNMTGSGGTPNYTYLWVPGGQTTSTINGLAVGTYTVDITDANGCISQGTATITQPNILNVTQIIANVTCNGVSNGSVSLSPSGGTTPYTNVLMPGNIVGANFNGLAQGTYTVITSDVNGCSQTSTITINQPVSINTNVTFTPATCGSNDGDASVSVTSGGTPPFTYLWSPGGQTTTSITNLTAGIYTIEVTDGSGCVSSNTVTLNNFTAPIVSIVSSNNISCYNGNDGNVVASHTAGNGPAYSYLWSPSGGTTLTASNLIFGAYIIQVTDGLGCIGYATSPNLTQPLPITIITDSTHVSCNGGNDGTATASATGGTGAYTYLWSPGGQTTASINGLTAGVYTVQVSDVNLCLATQTVSISEPVASLSVTASATPTSCFGGSDGTTTSLATGGTTPYSYVWMAGNINGSDLSNLAAGTYTINVTDAQGCTASANTTVNEPTQVTLVMSSVNSNCGNADGQAAVVAAGGTPGYTYVWSPSGGTTLNEINLLAGTYSVVVTDANGCSATDNTTVIDNPSQTVTVTSTTNVSCFGGSDGTATSTVVGGTGPFTYNWLPSGGTGSVANGLSIGTYTVEVLSSNGCLVTATSAVITEPLPVLPIATGTDVSCNGGNDGTATASATGGTGAYTYLWSPGGQTTSTISGLGIGIYTVTVQDANTCAITQTVEIVQPLLLTAVSTLQNDVRCFDGSDGSAYVTATGGTSPYSYTWLGAGLLSDTLTNVISGTYTVNITDINGCTTSSQISIGQPALPVSALVNTTGAKCNGSTDGTATVVAGGGTSPYTYSWNTSANTSSIENNLGLGNYFVTVFDANNCELNLPYSISEPSVIQGSLVLEDAECGLANGAITAQISGGTPSYSYMWSSGGSTTAVLNSIVAGSYSVTITDANNCQLLLSGSLNDLPGPAITPIATTPVSCFNGNNGTATVSISLGTTPYSVLWQPYGGNDTVAVNLEAGTYSVTVTDEKGCSDQELIQIIQPTQLIIDSVTTVPVLCNGGNNGQITIAVSGGVPTYNYQWQPSNIDSASITGLNAGVYSVLVTDTNGCSVSTVATVSEPTPLNDTILNVFHPICLSSIGNAMVLVGGGVTPYSYLWDQTGETTNILTATQGTYAVNIMDANGCTITDSVTLIAPTMVQTNAGIRDTICSGQQAALLSTATGGAGTYTYTWMPGLQINNGTFTPSPTSNITYTVVAFDQNGCAGIPDTVGITVYNLSNSNIIVSGLTPICQGQASLISSQIIGNTGQVTTSWNNGLGSGNGPFIVQPTQATTYVLSVTSSCGVTVQDSVRIDFYPPPTIVYSADATEICAPGVVSFSDNSFSNASADPISSWNWDFGDGTYSSDSNPVHEFSDVGSYSVTLVITTDAGCTSNSSANPIVVNSNPSPTAGFTVNATEFNLPFDALHCTNSSIDAVSYSWDFGDGNYSSETGPTHLYTTVDHFQIQLVATNQFGCTDTAFQEVVTNADVIFPNIFTPNPGGPTGGSYTTGSLTNDVFFPYTSGVVEYKLEIYNRWGELIFESQDINIGWDGYYRNEMCPLGVYVWKAYIKLNNGKEFNKSGDVTLLR
ncbi:MAG: PKD domain-containing protein, partial [Bacteroidota bacterium]|nr:PKD domain-containing protein [Bacteroidota bacterium]